MKVSPFLPDLHLHLHLYFLKNLQLLANVEGGLMGGASLAFHNKSKKSRKCCIPYSALSLSCSLSTASQLYATEIPWSNYYPRIMYLLHLRGFIVGMGGGGERETPLWEQWNLAPHQNWSQKCDSIGFWWRKFQTSLQNADLDSISANSAFLSFVNILYPQLHKLRHCIQHLIVISITAVTSLKAND